MTGAHTPRQVVSCVAGAEQSFGGVEANDSGSPQGSSSHSDVVQPLVLPRITAQPLVAAVDLLPSPMNENALSCSGNPRLSRRCRAGSGAGLVFSM